MGFCALERTTQKESARLTEYAGRSRQRQKEEKRQRFSREGALYLVELVAGGAECGEALRGLILLVAVPLLVRERTLTTTRRHQRQLARKIRLCFQTPRSGSQTSFSSLKTLTLSRSSCCAVFWRKTGKYQKRDMKKV